jgi:hypothetical protein
MSEKHPFRIKRPPLTRKQREQLQERQAAHQLAKQQAEAEAETEARRRKWLLAGIGVALAAALLFWHFVVW